MQIDKFDRSQKLRQKCLDERTIWFLNLIDCLHSCLKSSINALDITQASGKLTATFPWKRRSTKVPTGWNSLKISFPKVISRVFTCKFQNINIASVSGHSGRFIFKLLQAQSITSQFHDFYESLFWQVFVIWPNSMPAAIFNTLPTFDAII